MMETSQKDIPIANILNGQVYEGAPLTGDVELVDADEVVISTRSIDYIFSYPLQKPWIVSGREKEHGFTRQELYDQIRDFYQRAFEAPEEYGITGHDISDLMIESISYNPKNKRVTTFVDS